MEPIVRKMSTIDKVLQLENMGYMCANCKHEGILHVNDLRYQETGNILEMVKTCPSCGEERFYRYGLADDEKSLDLMNISMLINNTRRK